MFKVERRCHKRPGGDKKLWLQLKSASEKINSTWQAAVQQFSLLEKSYIHKYLIERTSRILAGEQQIPDDEDEEE